MYFKLKKILYTYIHTKDDLISINIIYKYDDHISINIIYFYNIKLNINKQIICFQIYRV